MPTIDTLFPATVNDLGDGRSGTRTDSAFWELVKDAIDDQCLSATNPTVSPADAIDLVVAAAGSTASVDARLDVEHNEDGTHNLTGVLATLATTSQLLGGIGAVNLIVNDDDMVWPDGDTSAPEGETLAGAAAAILRCGTSLVDTNRKVGDFCVRLTRAAADVTLTRSVLAGAAFTRADFLIGQYAAAGCWVKCSDPNTARIAIYDGAGTATSAYHTGGGAWEWLAITRQINVAADRLEMIRQVNNAAAAAYFSGRTLMLLSNNLTLTRYSPCPKLYGSIHFGVGGNVVAGAEISSMTPARCGYVKDVQLHAKTAPTGANLIVDINTYDGASQTSMFSTRPQIIAAANNAGAQPDTTYARRCFRGGFGATLTAGGLITMDVDQVGSGTAGAGLSVDIRAVQYVSALEQFQAYNGT